MWKKSARPRAPSFVCSDASESGGEGGPYACAEAPAGAGIDSGLNADGVERGEPYTMLIAARMMLNEGSFPLDSLLHATRKQKQSLFSHPLTADCFCACCALTRRSVPARCSFWNWAFRSSWCMQAAMSHIARRSRADEPPSASAPAPTAPSPEAPPEAPRADRMCVDAASQRGGVA